MFMRMLFVMAALVATLLPAFSASAATSAPPAGAWTPGNYRADAFAGKNSRLGISGVTGQGSLTREYIVHVPKSYDSNVQMPLVFCSHAGVEAITMFCSDGSRTISSWVDATGASPGNFI